MASRDDSGGTETGYLLDGQGIGVRLLTRERGFALLHNVHTGSGAQPACYAMDTVGSFPGF
jgi:hypothetical protein